MILSSSSYVMDHRFHMQLSHPQQKTHLKFEAVAAVTGYGPYLQPYWCFIEEIPFPCNWTFRARGTREATTINQSPPVQVVALSCLPWYLLLSFLYQRSCSQLPWRQLHVKTQSSTHCVLALRLHSSTPHLEQFLTELRKHLFLVVLRFEIGWVV